MAKTSLHTHAAVARYLPLARLSCIITVHKTIPWESSGERTMKIGSHNDKIKKEIQMSCFFDS